MKEMFQNRLIIVGLVAYEEAKTRGCLQSVNFPLITAIINSGILGS